MSTHYYTVSEPEVDLDRIDLTDVVLPPSLRDVDAPSWVEEEEDEDSSDPWGELLRELGEEDSEDEGLASRNEVEGGSPVPVCDDATPAPTIPGNPRFDAATLDIVLNAKKGLYSLLKPIVIRTITPCTDERDALYQARVLTKMNRKGYSDLMADLLRDELGSSPGSRKKDYLPVIERNSHVITINEKTIRLRDGSTKTKKDFRPKFLTRSGHGRCCRYIVAKKYRKVPWKERPTFTLTGAALARYIRAENAAWLKMQERLTPKYEFLLRQSQRVTLDVRAAIEAGASSSEIKRAMGLLSHKKPVWSIEQTGRVHLPVTNVCKALRPFLRFDGEHRLTSIDVCQAHPSFLIHHALTDWHLPEEEQAILRRLAAGKMKEAVGENLIKWLNAEHGKKAFSEIEGWFQENVPEFHARFKEHRRELKHQMRKLYSADETEIMMGALDALERAGLAEFVAAREHDGFRVVEAHAESMLAIVQKHLDMVSNGVLRVKIKSPESEREEYLEEKRRKETLASRNEVEGGSPVPVCDDATPPSAPRPKLYLVLAPDDELKRITRLITLAEDHGISSTHDIIAPAVSIFSDKEIERAIRHASRRGIPWRRRVLKKSLSAAA